MLLGLAVGDGTTAFDEWFQRLGRQHPALGYLLVFTDARVTLGLGVCVLLIALYRRRWRLAAVVAVAPLLAVLSARIAKRLFGRYKDDALAYPSGHTTVAVVVLGMAVLVAGAATWTVIAATVTVALGVVGQGVTYHFFTDAVGAVLLGTALVAVVAVLAGRGPDRPATKLDGCQPGCDVDHSGR